MSQYLNIYIVPRKKEGETEEKKPMYLTAFSYSTDVYDELTTVKLFKYCNSENDYTDLEAKDIREAIASVDEQIENTKNAIEVERKNLRHLQNNDVIEGLLCQIEAQEAHIKEDFNPTKKQLEHLLWLAEEIEGEYSGSEFEKLVANIG